MAAGVFLGRAFKTVASPQTARVLSTRAFQTMAHRPIKMADVFPVHQQPNISFPIGNPCVNNAVTSIIDSTSIDAGVSGEFSLVIGDEDDEDEGVNRLRRKRKIPYLVDTILECRRDRGEKAKTKLRRMERRARRAARNEEKEKKRNRFTVNTVLPS